LPLGRDDAGTIESVKKMQREQLLSYLNTYYRPNSLVISVAGNIDQPRIVEQVERLFGDWQSGSHPHWMESLPPHEAPAVRLVKKATEQTNIALATLGVAYGSKQYAPMLLLNALLGDGMSSRLFQSIREDQGLAYDIGSYFNSFYETGSLIISAGVDPTHTRETIRAIVAELTHLCREPVPDDELARTKAYVEGGVLLGLEGTHQVASWLGNQECLYNRVWTIDEIINEIHAVTAQDIQQVARMCFAPAWRRLAIIGPENVRQVKQFEELLVDA
jgi:predicted Zn-dependent peptidase